MHLFFIFSILFVSVSLLSRCSSSPNQLNGKHLRVIWPRWSGNPKGLNGPLQGGVFLNYLSARLNFTYEMVRVTEEQEPTPGGGQIKYVVDQQCDLLIHNLIPTIRRNKIVDLTLPWFYNPTAFLIPIADERANIYAVVKPFQLPIWLGLVISVVCVIVVLNFMQLYTNYRNKKEIDTIQSQNDSSKKSNTGNHFRYVFGTLLSQGGPCTSKRLPIRLVAGVWCLAAFIFVQAYSSLLFSYVVAPVNQPLINSIYDLFEHPDINLFVRTGTIDILKENYNTGVFHKLEIALDSNPNSRCFLPSDCVKRITPGSRNTYLEAKFALNDVIKADFKSTGKCNFELARDVFMTITSTWALPKNSPYTGSINMGILELHQAGIIDKMDRLFYPMPPQCDGKPKSKKNESEGNKLSRLSLKNLTGAFVILLVGMSLSFFVFLCEMIVANMPRRSRVQKIEEHSEPKNIYVEKLDVGSPPITEDELPPIGNGVKELLVNVVEVEEIEIAE